MLFRTGIHPSFEELPHSLYSPALLFGGTTILKAQVRSATITGTVKDSTGAVVVGANVLVKNTDTQGILPHPPRTEAVSMQSRILPRTATTR